MYGLITDRYKILINGKLQELASLSRVHGTLYVYMTPMCT